MILAAMVVGGCNTPSATSPADVTKEAWYAPETRRLTGMNQEAEKLFASGKSDEAAALIEQGQTLVARLLSAPQPAVEAVEAASDLDDLYGRMLLSNRHYGWARLQFQKNLSRWRHWKPQSPESIRRWKRAESEIAQCDRHIVE